MILGSDVGFFSISELLHDMYGLSVSVFYCHLSMFCPVLSSEEAILLTTGQERTSCCVLVNICGPYKFLYPLHYDDWYKREVKKEKKIIL